MSREVCVSPTVYPISYAAAAAGRRLTLLCQSPPVVFERHQEVLRGRIHTRFNPLTRAPASIVDCAPYARPSIIDIVCLLSLSTTPRHVDNCTTRTRLEAHGVGPVAVGEREGRGEVLCHDGSRLLNGANDGLVESLLVCHLALRVRLLVCRVSKEAGLGLGTRDLLPAEVSVVELLVDGHAREVNLGRRSNDVGLVDATNGDAVDLEGASNQQEARLELLEEDDALAAETASEEDEDGSWLDALAELSGASNLAGSLGLLDVLGRVVARSLGDGDGTRTALLELLRSRLGRLVRLGGNGLARLDSLVAALLAEGLA